MSAVQESFREMLPLLIVSLQSLGIFPDIVFLLVPEQLLNYSLL